MIKDSFFTNYYVLNKRAGCLCILIKLDNNFYHSFLLKSAIVDRLKKLCSVALRGKINVIFYFFTAGNE